MKYSVAVVLAAAAAGANAQAACLSSALAIPACGTSALLSLGSSYGCGLTDFACQCSNSAAIQSAASSPVIAACSVETALSVQMSAQALCSCVAANGGGSSGGSSGAASASAVATTAAAGGATSAAAGSSMVMATSAAGASSAAVFTGAAPSAGVLAPVGGVLAGLAGLIAYL